MLTAGMGDKKNRAWTVLEIWESQEAAVSPSLHQGTGWRRDPTHYHGGDLASTVLPTLWPSSPKATTSSKNFNCCSKKT